MRRVFLDVDTQNDFVLPAGALYVPGAERLLPQVAALNRFAVERGIPLIATADAHLENDPEFSNWPPHCIAGTLGQQKPAETIPDKYVSIPADSTAAPAETAGFYLLEKRSTNCFTNRALEPLLRKLGAEECVVYGFVTEICVRHAVSGLLDAGYRVTVVRNATKELDPVAGQELLAMVEARGGSVVTADRICAANG